ncbi:MAG: glycosyltransferase family 4 protein, partial [Bacteroidota bacterium]|nr:glycosyltransferase family 4 protein [Bacteroidota bacterium]
ASRSFTITPYFSHAWVPGERQVEFALKLGFAAKRILKGFYSADFNYFHSLYSKNKEQKEKEFPKRFIYVGRYIEHKGIKDLWRAFIELQNEKPSDWELWCLGVGPLKEQEVQHPKIKHFGFVQPSEMKKIIADSGVFVLPSHFEPWGVVVHEFAAAGFPLICSDKVGANSAFLKQGENGFIYHSADVEALKNRLKKMTAQSKEQLLEMGEKSIEKAKLITPEKWALTIIDILSRKKNALAEK